MKVELTPCFILHHRDYRENSLILDVFSEEHGRLDLVAKGIKNNKKQQSVSYELYQKYLLSWVSRSELGTLTDIELAKRGSQLKPELMMAGFYINEVTIRLLHKHEPHPELFNAYETTIAKLKNGESEHIVLRYYECELLQSLGYGIVLDYDVLSGEKVSVDHEYLYQIDSGPSIVSGNTKTISGIRVSGKTLLELSRQSLSHEVNVGEAKYLLRSILKKYLGEKPLASRKLYQAYIQNKKTV